MKKFNPTFLVAVALAGLMVVTSTRPSLALQAFVTIVNCAISTACVVGNNTSTGPGVQGTSSLGRGVVGQTKRNSTLSSNGQAGVLGQDLSTSGIFDTGVSGTSVRGVGVLGTSSSNAGVSGTSTSGTGVRGTSSSTSGVVGTTSTGAQAILGQAVNTVGVKGQTTSSSGAGAGVQGISNASGSGVLGQSTNGIGLQGVAPHSAGVLGNGFIGVEAEDLSASTHTGTVLFGNGFGAQLFRLNNSHGTDVATVSDFGILNSFAITAGSSAVGTGVNANGAFAGVQGSAATANARGVQGNNTSSSGSTAVYANGFGGAEFRGNGSNGADNFIVDNSGNVFAHGFFATLAAAQPTTNGATIQTYSHETRSPTIEDFGEATLAAGHAYVRLDPSFSGALARGVPYFVFITPLGPTRGSLYVSQRTAGGFYVHENGGGASTVAFDYRIVGKRYMATNALRPMVTLHAPKIPPVIPTFETHPKTRSVIPH
jgi:hypothetical protein